MSPLEALHLQLHLEGKQVVRECLLRQVEIVPGEDAPLVLLAGLADGRTIAYYDEAISPVLQQELEARVRESAFPQIDPVLEVLRERNIPVEIGHYKTYVFPTTPAKEEETKACSKHDAKIKDFGFEGFAEKVYVIEREGRVVCACVSARENERCGEAWIFTDPAYRHQGLAQKAVRAWAGALMEAGKVPFYSHTVQNTASANLARRLGLQPVFEEIVITSA